MTELDKIITKLKKLLALSKSSNANEAAVALEMAQKLMAEHGIKSSAIGEFEIVEEEVRGNGGKRPPHYESRLVKRVAGAFGCRWAYGIVKIDESVSAVWGHTFVGLEHRVKIASFMADVLLRKLKKARTEYIKKLYRVRTRAVKIKRADEFCFGWVVSVASKLAAFENSEEEQTAVDAFVDNLNWGGSLKTIKRKRAKNSGIEDFSNGHRAAANIQLQHGVEGEESGARLLGAAN
jgi:hypothetical protein